MDPLAGHHHRPIPEASTCIRTWPNSWWVALKSISLGQDIQKELPSVTAGKLSSKSTCHGLYQSQQQLLSTEDFTHTHTHTRTHDLLFWMCVSCIRRLSRWFSGKEATSQCRRRWFDPWVRKSPWRRKWQPNLVFLPGKSHGQRSLVGNSP